MLLGLRCSIRTSGLRPPNCKVRSLFTSLLVILYGSNDLVSFISVFTAISILPSRERIFKYLCKEGRKLGKKEIRKDVKKEVGKGSSKSAHDCPPLAGYVSMDSFFTGPSFTASKITGLQSMPSKTL